jgi:hypothetical protein
MEKRNDMEIETKMYVNIPIRKLRRKVAVCELQGEKSEDCRREMKEIGISLVDEPSS